MIPTIGEFCAFLCRKERISALKWSELCRWGLAIDSGSICETPLLCWPFCLAKSETQSYAFAILLVISVLRLLNKQAQSMKNVHYRITSSLTIRPSSSEIIRSAFFWKLQVLLLSGRKRLSDLRSLFFMTYRWQFCHFSEKWLAWQKDRLLKL